MRKLSRSGTEVKIIHYTMPKNDKRFLYQDHKYLQEFNPTIELTGNLNIGVKKYIEPKEINNFRRINLKNLPDTKRTLVPELNNEPIKRCKSSINIREENTNQVNRGNIQQIINKTELEKNITEKPKKCYYDVNKDKKNNENDSHKSCIKFNQYSKYNHTTQITYLPGGCKRNQNEISDDKMIMNNHSNKGTNNIYQKKLESDYRSKISCLPNSMNSQKLNVSDFNQINENEKLNNKKQPHLKNHFTINENDYYNKVPKSHEEINEVKNQKYFYQTESNVTSNNVSNLNNEGKKYVNFFKKPSQNYQKTEQPTKLYNSDKMDIMVKQYNPISHNLDTYKFLNAHGETNVEKNLIPHPKAKPKGFKNPFISQIKIK